MRTRGWLALGQKKSPTLSGGDCVGWRTRLVRVAPQNLDNKTLNIKGCEDATVVVRVCSRVGEKGTPKRVPMLNRLSGG